MYVLGNLFIALARVADLILSFLMWIIFFRAMISWVSPDPNNPIVQFLYRITEPILEPIRRILPMSRIDISPILAFVMIIFLQSFLVASLRDIGYHMHQRGQSQSPVQQTQFEPVQPVVQEVTQSEDLF